MAKAKPQKSKETENGMLKCVKNTIGILELFTKKYSPEDDIVLSIKFQQHSVSSFFFCVISYNFLLQSLILS